MQKGDPINLWPRSGAITAWPEIDRVTFLHRDAALSQFAEQTELSSVLSSLNRNPLPHTLLVAPVMPMPQQTLEGLVGKLGDLSEVDRVVANTRWMARLEQVLQAGWRWGWALGIAMVCGATLVLVNTLYLDVDARREEIRVVSLIGGSPAFVRRPFLYSGLYFGAGGGVLATIGLWAFTAWVAGPVNAYFSCTTSPIHYWAPAPRTLSRWSAWAPRVAGWRHFLRRSGISHA